MDKWTLQAQVLVLLLLTNATMDSFWKEPKSELAKKMERGQERLLPVDVSYSLIN